MDAVIKSVEMGSIAEEAGIESGDILVSIDGNPLYDILDYKYLTASEEFQVEILKKNGDIELIEIINEDYEDLGIEFEKGLLDNARVCKNRCVFCFIDQLPKGMRETLYFKDDDYRLSTLMGNYITLTNISEKELQRIIDLHLPRINVSVHTTNPALRQKMISNPNSDVLAIMNRLKDAGIFMDCQIVLVPGYNDKEELDNTISDLVKLYPYVQSISVVPVGLTKFREHLPCLEKFGKINAQEAIRQVEEHQKRCLNTIDTRFVFASDEFYIAAGMRLPKYEDYESFLQIENGVGLIASLQKEYEEALEDCDKIIVKTKKTTVTGVSSYPYIQKYVDMLNTEKIAVIPIKNKFFGESITVTGLITAGDIIEQLQGKELGDILLIPSVMLNHDGVFLDDKTINDIEDALQVKVETVNNDGYDLLDKLTL